MSIEKKIAKQDAIRNIRDDETRELPKICSRKYTPHRAKEYNEKLKTICDSCAGFGEYFSLGTWYKCDEYDGIKKQDFGEY